MPPTLVVWSLSRRASRLPRPPVPRHDKDNGLIVVFAGVQADTEQTTSPRLPASSVADLDNRVRRLLARLKPSLVIGAAAGGADLIVTRAARLEDVPVRVVLPHDRATFRDTSVPPNGQVWLDRYDRLLDELPPDAIEEHDDDPAGEGVYETHNRRLLDRAIELAVGTEQVWALVIRPGGAQQQSVTDDFAARAEERGFLLLDLDPLRAVADRPSVFVAMPYGKKFDPDTRRTIDCDVIFDRVYVPALEDCDMEWQRADLEADSGIIHAGMIDALAHADIVIADLSTGNANVAYELGLRHGLAEHMTILTKPMVVGQPPQPVPFDVMPIRHVRFDRSENTLKDQEAADAICALRRTLQQTGATRDVDSPVYAWFERDAGGALVQRGARSGALQAELALRQQARLAVQSSAAERMREALAAVEAADVAEDVRAALRLELAVGLLHEGMYDEAAAPFALAEPAIGHPLRLRWLQQHALLHSWRGRQADDAGDDPSSHWIEGERLLQEARREFGDSEETCGILGGLVKRRFRRAVEKGRATEAAAILERMNHLYQAGFEAEPNYYAGVNLVASLRLLRQRFSTYDIAADDIQRTSTIVRFFAERARNADPDAFWPAVTLAELDLHDALLADDETANCAAASYAAAAQLPAPGAWRQTAVGQLELLASAGDPSHTIATMIRLLQR
jgi:hypothetical protein